MAAADEVLADKIAMAAIRLTRTLQALNRGGPLTPPQIGALVVIVYAKQILARDLALHQQVTAATVSRLVAELEARGLVVRTLNKADARQLWITATPEGAKVVAKEHARRLAPLAKTLARCSSAERRRLEDAVALIDMLTRSVAG